MITRLLTALAISCLLLPSFAMSQALTNLSLLRVRYNSQKVSVQPAGELKVHIDALDAEIAEATRLGQTGEARRLFAKGNTLLAGNPWTDEVDFSNSLVLRSDRVVVDPADRYLVRLEQIYRPAIQLDNYLNAHASLTNAAAGQRRAAPVKDFGNFDGVSRDLRESPYFFELDLAGVADGVYQLNVDISLGDRVIGNSQLFITIRQGLNELVSCLEQGSATAPAAIQADILYPVDRMGQVNRGRLELRTFNPETDFAAAEAVLASSQAGNDPFAGRSGAAGLSSRRLLWLGPG